MIIICNNLNKLIFNALSGGFITQILGEQKNILSKLIFVSLYINIVSY